jgi:hypothetical protein
MKASTKKLRVTNSASKVSVVRFMEYFSRFSKSEQLKIADKINATTFSKRWARLDKQLPDAAISEEQIMNELRLVRYGKKGIKNSA